MSQIVLGVMEYRYNARIRLLCNRIIRRAKLTADVVFDITLYNNHHWIVGYYVKNAAGKRSLNRHTQEAEKRYVRLRATSTEIEAAILATSRQRGGDNNGSDTRSNR